MLEGLDDKSKELELDENPIDEDEDNNCDTLIETIEAIELELLEVKLLELLGN